MRYIKPNFNFEWEEAKRYPEFLEIGKDGWMEIGEKGKPCQFSTIQDITGNVDLNFNNLEKDKKNRFYDAFDKGVIEMPIVVKFSDLDYDLVAGNTRLSGLILNKRDPYVWVIDMTMNELEENTQFSPPPHERETYNKIMNSALEEIKKMKGETKEQWDHEEEPISNSDDYEIDFDDDDEKTNGHHKKKETKEETGASDAGAFVTALDSPIKKGRIYEIHNVSLEEETGSSVSAGASYDVPFAGKTPKGRKNPLKIDGPESIGKTRAVKDKNFPKFGGPGGVYIKIKDKCKKFPYCNQGDINAIEILRESIEQRAKKYGLPKEEVEKIVLKGIKQIFI
jgi:hypothetical protein